MEKKLTKVRFDYESVKIISFEDGPLVDKQHSYHIIFSTETCCSRWEVNHKFSHFKLLNLLIKKLAPKFVSAEFPKDHVGSSFLGIKLSDKVMESRRRMLEDWLKEVIASYELFPEDIAHNLRSFINAPKVTRVEILQPSSEQPPSPSARNTGDFVSKKRGDIGVAGSGSKGAKRALPAAVSSYPPVAKPNPIESFITKTILKASASLRRGLVSLSSKLVHSGDGSTVLCLSRRNEVILSGYSETRLSQPLLKDLVDEISVQTNRCAIAYFISLLLSNLLFWVLLPRSIVRVFSDTVQLALRFFSWAFLLFCRVLMEDLERKQSSAAAAAAGTRAVGAGTGRSSQSVVEDSMRIFFRIPEFSYSECGVENHAFYDDDHNKTSSNNKNTGGSGKKHGTKAITCTATTEVTGSDIFKLSSSAAAATATAALVPLHESLVPGSTFDNVDFLDVSPQAKALYADRSEEHSFKLRGENYLMDNKKYHPGPAMCKLLLLELYEVETKDGDRHDHVVSRGAAKRRLEALRTLPDKPFFFVMNFQIPGDPPVSLVCYFGLPVDLLDRYPGPETERFLATFERFIDMPRTEEERLAAWGITTRDPSPSISAVLAGDHNNSSSNNSGSNTGASAGAGTTLLDNKGTPPRRRFNENSKESSPSSIISQVDAKSHGAVEGAYTSEVRRRQSYTRGSTDTTTSNNNANTDNASSSNQRTARPVTLPKGFVASLPGGLAGLTSHLTSSLPLSLPGPSSLDILRPSHESSNVVAAKDKDSGNNPNSNSNSNSNSSSNPPPSGIPYFRRALSQFVRKNKASSSSSDRGAEQAGDHRTGQELSRQPDEELSVSPRLRASSQDDADINSPHRLRRAKELAGSSNRIGGSSSGRILTSSEAGELDAISDSEYATDKMSESDEQSTTKKRSPKRASHSGVSARDIGLGGRTTTTTTTTTGNGSGTSASAAASSSSLLAHPPATASGGGGTATAGWKLPSDISWPEPHEPGALPPSDYRNQRFKLIPCVTEGPWVVKTAVRSTPALLGKKVVQRYFRGDDYMEVDVNVGSSKIAANIVGLCRGYTKHFSTDVGVVIQGESEMELPEKMLACGALKRIEVDIRQKLD